MVVVDLLMAMERDARSRSPHGKDQTSGVSAKDDVDAAHRVREAYIAPKQSKFRVAARLRFVRPDGVEGTIEAVNAEPHDANIRGAICAERVALCQFQRHEACRGSRISRVVCVTDAPFAIFPGPCCREFLTSTCMPDCEIVASGSKEGSYDAQPLRELLPLPSVYAGRDQDAIMALAKGLSAKVKAPVQPNFASAYVAALQHAKRQQKQATIFPVLFASAAHFADGRTPVAAELKGIEYGCTVDAVSLLMPELIRSREEGLGVPSCIMQVDQFGVAHAPFAAARSLLIEHGFGDVLVNAHKADGDWAAPIKAREAMPHATYTEMEFTHAAS